MKKIFFFLAIFSTALNGEPSTTQQLDLQPVPDCHDLKPYHRLVNWAKDNPKRAAIALVSVLGPTIAIYGYCFKYQEILDFIGTLSYKTVETASDISSVATNKALNAAVDSVVKDPALYGKVLALGLSYQTIIYGIPFLLTNFIKWKLGVK